MLEGLFSPCIYWLFSELPCSCSGRKSFLNSAKELGKAFVASKQPSAEKKPALQQPPLPATKLLDPIRSMPSSGTNGNCLCRPWRNCAPREQSGHHAEVLRGSHRFAADD